MSRRFSLILEDRQFARLEADSIRSGLAVGELIRRAVDQATALDDARRAAIASRRPGVRFRDGVEER